MRKVNLLAVAILSAVMILNWLW